MKENLIVACCICGFSLGITNAVQLTVCMQSNPDQVQAFYAYPKCFDRVLHISVPRHPNLSDNDNH
jgi:hypothetical protein